MRHGTCCQCGVTAPIRSFYSMNGLTYCEPCVWKAAREARDAGQPSEYISLTDNSVCARCGADNGNSDFPVVGKLPLCQNCALLVTDWPYPQWIKLAFLFLLALLLVALVHGRKYFQAGRNLYTGERLIDEHHYSKAVPYLENTLKVAPGSDKAALLAAKAALLSGNVKAAGGALHGHDDGRFPDNRDALFQEVDGLWNRAMQAYDKAEAASKLAANEGHEIEAARLMHEAAALYPESSELAIAADMYDEGAAYARQDYDSFVALTEKVWNEVPQSDTAAAVASALACKYAVSGDLNYRQRSEEMLAKAQQLAHGDAAHEQEFQEYSERIRYRLDTRQIISKQQYDEKFRGAKSKLN